MVLTINGKNEVCLNKRDFVFLVQQYMGDECKDCLEALFQGYEEQITELKNDILLLESELSQLEDALVDAEGSVMC